MKLANKVAIVTGASGGMGADIALTLAREGADVVLAAGTVDAADIPQQTRPGTISDIAAKITAMGRRALPVRTDVSRKSDTEALISRAIAEFGRIDILVNAAWPINFGENPLGDLLDEALTDAAMGAFRGVVDGTRSVLPHMKRAGGGSIINITSMGAKSRMPSSPVSGALKAAVTHFSASVASAVAADGIRINCVAPGAIESASNHDCLPRVLETLRTARVPMQPLGGDEDVALAVLFLADESIAGYITGTTITVDDGLSKF